MYSNFSLHKTALVLMKKTMNELIGVSEQNEMNEQYDMNELSNQSEINNSIK